MGSVPHRPVLLREVLKAFEPLNISVFVDGTLGAGGHAQALLEEHKEIQHYLGIDQDPHALSLSKEHLVPWISKLSVRHGNFDQIDEFLKNISLNPPQGILVDLGVSSMQLNEPLRGFSFMHDGPLDMRMNPDLPVTAADIVNTYSEESLGKVFREYGEEKQWRLAARVIVRARQTRPFLTTNDLNLVLRPILFRFAKKGINPLTLIFQALRICVNEELKVLESFIPKALEILAPGGRLAIISFHSLEDRIVKTHFRLAASDKWETSGIGGLFLDKDPTIRLITQKPIEASAEEVIDNPRSRSAKLRIAEKLGNNQSKSQRG